MSNGYRHYAGLVGSKEIWVGKDADIYNYTSVATAVAAANPGDEVHVTSGTYTETAVVALAQSMSLIGHGDVTITSAVATSTVSANVPAAGSAAVNIYVKNIKFINTVNDACIVEQDGGSSGILTTVWEDCGFTGEASSNAINVIGNHATTTCNHYFYGKRHLPLSPDSTIDLNIAASNAHISGYLLDDGETIVSGDATTAWILHLDNIVYSATSLISGGGAALIINLTNCALIASGAIAPPVVEHCAGTEASANVQIGTLDT